MLVVLGIVQLTGGFSLLAGNTYGRVIGIIGGSLGAIGALLSIGERQPVVVAGQSSPVRLDRHGIIVLGEDERALATRGPMTMAEPQPWEERGRVLRTLTFWLRPDFVLRVVSRFQKLAGFDRAIALASGALTAFIPLTIAASTVASDLGGKGTAERLIDRYELTGGGAEAVKDIFAPPDGVEHEPRHPGVPLPDGRGAELHPRRAAAVRAEPGSSSR